MTELVVGIICGLINYWVGFYFGQKHSNGKDNVVIQIQLEKKIECDDYNGGEEK